MTIADAKIIEQNSYSTSGSSIQVATVLSIALMTAQYSGLQEQAVIEPIQFEKTSSSQAGAVAFHISEVEIFGQINRVLDELIENQTELDTDSKKALYQNLWNLYT